MLGMIGRGIKQKGTHTGRMLQAKATYPANCLGNEQELTLHQAVLWRMAAHVHLSANLFRSLAAERPGCRQYLWGMHTREIIRRLLRGAATTVPLNWLLRLSGQRLLVPLYHLVSDAPVPHVQHLYPVKTVAQFSHDLDFLLKHYQPIDLPELLRLLQAGRQPARNAVLLTFDDGLREFHDVVAPVLRARGVPAVCFLNSDFLDNQGLFYRYQASLLLEVLSREAHLAQAPAVRVWQAAHAAPGQSLRAAVLSIAYPQRAALSELAALLGVDFGQYLRTQQPYLSTPQVLALQDQGFHFGAHSCDHPEYRLISLAEQLRQTHDSLAAVATAFQPACQSFAFPFTDYGVSDEFFRQMYQPGSPLEVSFGCAGLKHEAWPRHVQRVPLETADARGAHDIVPTEYLYYLLKALLGRNTIRRPAHAP